MIDINYYRKISNSYQVESKVDYQVNELHKSINKNFEKNIAYKNVKINDIERGVHIVDENAITKNPNRKRLLCKYNESISRGDYVYWDNNYWLCTNVDIDDTYQSKGIIDACNNVLNVNKNSILSQMPCVIGSSLQGVDEGKYLNIPEGIIVVRASNNNITSQIERGEIYKFAENENYKVMDINSIIENGLIVMKMEWTAEQPEIIPVPEPIQPIIIDGETSITKGYAKTYTVDNSEIGEVVFSIIGNSASIQSQNGVAGTCTVLAGDVLGNVRLWCKTIDGLVEGYKDIRVRSIF